MALTTRAIAPLLLRTITLFVLGMGAPILAPVVAVLLEPRFLRPSLVIAIVSIAAQLRLLPSSAPLPLTRRLSAVTLIRNLATRQKTLMARLALPPLHAEFSVHSICTGACTTTSEDHNVHSMRVACMPFTLALEDINISREMLLNQIS